MIRTSRDWPKPELSLIVGQDASPSWHVYSCDPSDPGAVPDRAAWALARIGHAAVPSLIPLLGSQEDYNLRWLVAVILAEIGPDVQAAAPALSEGLRSQDYCFRLAAARALAAIKPATSDVLPGLLVALNDDKLLKL
jgi:HEAT repeat protein